MAPVSVASPCTAVAAATTTPSFLGTTINTKQKSAHDNKRPQERSLKAMRRRSYRPTLAHRRCKRNDNAISMIRRYITDEQRHVRLRCPPIRSTGSRLANYTAFMNAWRRISKYPQPYADQLRADRPRYSDVSCIRKSKFSLRSGGARRRSACNHSMHLGMNFGFCVPARISARRMFEINTQSKPCRSSSGDKEEAEQWTASLVVSLSAATRFAVSVRDMMIQYQTDPVRPLGYGRALLSVHRLWLLQQLH